MIPAPCIRQRYHSLHLLKALRPDVFVAVLTMMIFLMHVLFPPLYFVLRMQHIREYVRQSIDYQEGEVLEQISLTSQQFKELDWIEEGKEFRKQGILYDVVKIDEKKDSLVLWCYRDIDEMELYSTITRYVSFLILQDGACGQRYITADFQLLYHHSSVLSKTSFAHFPKIVTYLAINSIACRCFFDLEPEIPPPRTT